MRVSNLDVPVTFRVTPSMMTAAEAKARKEGMSLSELMRHALRQTVREAA